MRAAVLSRLGVAMMSAALLCCDRFRGDAKRAGLPPAEISTSRAPLRIDIPGDTPATELSHLVALALGGTSRKCWVVWGDYRATNDARPITFHGPDAGPISSAPAWVTCPAPDAADFIKSYGDARVKLFGMAYFRGDHFEYKGSSGEEDRLRGVLMVNPRHGSALDMLTRMSGVLQRCLFAYLWIRE
jgi:hypothetical protein